MVVYPAAGLIHYEPENCPVFIIDPACLMCSKKGCGIHPMKGRPRVLKLLRKS
jgi:hypothetical protein